MLGFERIVRSGFSLIELMVSITVMVLVMGLLTQVMEQFIGYTKEEIVSINGTDYPVAPSFSADLEAREVHSLFTTDLFEYPFAYVVGGNRVNPSNLSESGTALIPLSSNPTLPLTDYPSSCRLFEASTSSVLSQYNAGSRTFPSEEFSVLFLDGLSSVHSVYHVYKSSGTFDGEAYNVYEVLYQQPSNLSNSRSYTFAIRQSEDAFQTPVGATHRYHRYDSVWGIEEQDSVFVVFPDPILKSGGIDYEGNLVNPLSRFVYEIVF